MSKPALLFLFLLMLGSFLATGQSVYDTTLVHQDGRVMRVRISGTDTIIVATIPEVVVKAPRVFANDYEKTAHGSLDFLLVDNQNKPVCVLEAKKESLHPLVAKEQARKYAKEMQKEAKEGFTDPLKDLTRTQGKILVKMIERHLDTSMYEVLKSVRGTFTAAKWQTVGKLYGYDLKDGYTPGEDKVLDMILGDFEITVK